MSLCQQCIDWAKGENRVFLRQALEARLIALHVDTHNYTAALSIGRRKKLLCHDGYHSGVYCLCADVHLSSSYSSFSSPLPFLLFSSSSILLSPYSSPPSSSSPFSPSFLSFPPPLSSSPVPPPPYPPLPSSSYSHTGTGLLKELKKIDDKALLVEVGMSKTINSKPVFILFLIICCVRCSC